MLFKSCCQLKSESIDRLLKSKNIKNDLNFFKLEAENQFSKVFSQDYRTTLKSAADKMNVLYQQ